MMNIYFAFNNNQFKKLSICKIAFLQLTCQFLPLTINLMTRIKQHCIITLSNKGGLLVKVKVDISKEYKEPCAVVYASEITDEIQRIIDYLGSNNTPITALRNEEDIVILKPEEIYMVTIQDGNTIIYDKNQSYRSRKRLYELSEQLGKGFMQISKSTLVNLSYIDSIEPDFSGSLLLKLKNGNKDYVSRTYLKEFKKYLGL